MERKPDLATQVSQKVFLLFTQKDELEKLIVERQKMQARSAGSDLSTFTIQDLINVLVVAFALGFLIV